MAKKRPPNWQRGAPRPTTGEPQPIVRPESSGTADLSVSGERTVENTWDPTRQARANFAPISPPERSRRAIRVSPGWVSAALVAVGLMAAAILYVAGMKTDISVAGAKIDALQKSQDSWTSNLKAEISRVETSLDSKLARLSEILQGRGPVAREESGARSVTGSPKR